MKGIIYYTDNELGEPIYSIVQKQILKVGLPIVSVSLKPIGFGKNVVLNLEQGAITMTRQILAGLEASNADTVFFTEHDVLYHSSHFDFVPQEENTFYYNFNIWKWDYPQDRAVTYDNLTALSNICANRQLLLDHYREKLKILEDEGFDNNCSKNSYWPRKMGYEPGKPRKRGGISDDPCGNWRSPYPNIDIRHKGTLSWRRVKLDHFRQIPTGWQETTLDKIRGWNLKEMFNL